jgi:hypothetical protein
MWGEELRIPKAEELIELFVSKSAWYANCKLFGTLEANHPTLLKWFEGGEDAPSDMAAWGFFKTTYTVKDLQEVLEGKAESVKVKGKRKAAKSVSDGTEKKTKKGKKVSKDNDDSEKAS